MPKEIALLERRLGYTFGDKSILAQALTHSSYDGDKHRNNQRLEYLGDAVLQLVITDVLYRECPDMGEGQMTRVRSSLVREEALFHAAKGLKVGSFLVLGKGEENSGGREKPSILADTMEAIFGAIYLDGGMRSARTVITSVLGDLIAVAPSLDPEGDPKTRLQHLCTVALGCDVSYELVRMEGAPHERVFRVAAKAGEKIIAEGIGTSKKHAEMDAAQKALDKLARESKNAREGEEKKCI